MKKKVICVCNEPVCGMKVRGQNSPLLEIGKTYTVVEIEEHSFHTLYTLEEFPNKQFNSVDFKDIDWFGGYYENNYKAR